MPTISPLGGPVSWPENEGTIGVIGVAPWATLDFLKSLYAQVPVEKDWHFPRVICDINTKLPSRGRYFDLGERDPSPFIRQSIEELASQGATVVVVPCNTAHVLYDRWASSPPVSVPNIVDVTVEEMRTTGATCVATLSSKPVHTHRIYEQAIQRGGMKSVRLSEEDVALVCQTISKVKETGRITPNLLNKLRIFLRRQKETGVDGIIIACTELSSLQTLCDEHSLPAADSGTALAKAALAAANVPSMREVPTY